MKPFFDSVRASFGPLKQSQVEGFEKLLAATVNLLRVHRGYILATAWHETARTMQPIHERGTKDYFNKYNAGTRLGVALGNTLPGDGFRFRGRGYVQITGRRNYQRATFATGRDLVADPDRALEPATAAEIIVKGMVQGWFTGKKLSDCVSYRDMRRTVNGIDKADLIAGYAVKFEAALKAADAKTPFARNTEFRTDKHEPRQPQSVAPVPPIPDLPDALPEEAPVRLSFWQRVGNAFRRA